MKAGFLVSIDGQGGTARVASPDDHAEFPLVCRADHASCSCFLMGRLYYRRNVEREIAHDNSPHVRNSDSGNDAALALSVYQASGCAGLQQLEGDFAVLVWDSPRRQLIAVRDPMGGYPLFWTRQRSGTACATSLNDLVRLLERPELDSRFFAEYLMPTGARQEGPSELCAYRGIQRILPGQTVIIDVDQDRIERRTWWNWPDRMSDPGTDRLQDAAEQYGQVLRRAVQERIRGKTLAHLSGGIDSTGIALLARERIRECKSATSLHTVSLVYHRLQKLSLENPYLEPVLASLTDVTVHRIAADDLLNLDGLLDPPAHDEPFVGLWHIETDQALLQVGVTAGISTVLTGIGADEIHDWTPYYLADFVRRGRWMSAWRQASAIAETRGVSTWRILNSYGLHPLQQLLIARLGLRVPRRPQLRQLGPYDVTPWIAADFATSHGLQERGHANRRAAFGLGDRVHLSVALRSIQDRVGDMARMTLAAPQGIHIAHPFLDPRVISLGLGIRARIPMPLQPQKPVLNLALSQLLPPEIRQRRGKGHFDEVYYLGLVRNQQILRTLVDATEFDELGLFDHHVLGSCLEEALCGGVGAAHLQQFDAALSLLAWFSRRREWLEQRESLGEPSPLPVYPARMEANNDSQ